MIKFNIIFIFMLYVSQIKGVINVEFDNQRRDAADACKMVVDNYNCPHIISWFIGYHGLPASAAEFYKSKIFSTIKSSQKDVKFSLIDLSAWKILVEHEQASPTIKDLFRQHNSSDKINEKKDNIFQVEPANKFFEFLLNPDTQSAQRIDYILNNEKRNFILGQSLAYLKKKKERGIPGKLSLSELGAPSTQHLKNVETIDTDGIFSALQYIEGLYMAKKIAETNNHVNDIIFLLPNEEYKYYYDSRNSFQEDLNAMVNSNDNINVRFIRFDYGKMKTDSPCKISKNGNDRYLSDEEIVELV